jgi:hypothetical protein
MIYFGGPSKGRRAFLENSTRECAVLERAALAGDTRGNTPVARQQGLYRKRRQFVIVHHNSAFHYKSPDGGRRAQQSRGDRIFRAGVCWVAQIEERNIGALSWFQTADICAAKTLRATDGCHAQRLLYRNRRCAMAKTL